MTSVFEISPAKGTKLPIVISCPHVGTEIPDDIKATMNPIGIETEDTDWFIHELYGFAPEMGITLIKANYSRFVIDLNRDPTGKSLYSDQRRQTALVPMTTFSGEAIYPQTILADAEIERRKKLYFEPYHATVDEQLMMLRKSFKHVLFFDAHSIKRLVTSIRPDPFPDMIIGDNQGKTADPRLSEAALAALKGGNYRVSYNDPFMGGYLTRKQGHPEAGVHAIQLEMSQDLYMNEKDNSRNHTKQAHTAVTLQKMFQLLTNTLQSMNQ